MVDARRVIVIFVIAILFAILVHVSIDAFYPEPDYQDYCRNDMYNEPYAKAIPTETSQCSQVLIPQSLRESCLPETWNIQYRYNETGCATEAYCETCNVTLQAAREKHGFIVFIISSIAGLAAIMIGMFLPQEQDINEWIGSGFLLGGIFTIAISTGRFFGDLGRYIRPLVILVELALIIFIAYRKLGKSQKPEHKK